MHYAQNTIEQVRHMGISKSSMMLQQQIDNADCWLDDFNPEDTVPVARSNLLSNSSSIINCPPRNSPTDDSSDSDGDLERKSGDFVYSLADVTTWLNATSQQLQKSDNSPKMENREVGEIIKAIRVFDANCGYLTIIRCAKVSDYLYKVTAKGPSCPYCCETTATPDPRPLMFEISPGGLVHVCGDVAELSGETTHRVVPLPREVLATLFDSEILEPSPTPHRYSLRSRRYRDNGTLVPNNTPITNQKDTSQSKRKMGSTMSPSPPDSASKKRYNSNK